LTPRGAARYESPMGETRIPAPGLVVVGVLHPASAPLEDARRSLGRVLGEVHLVSRPVRFGWTGYYRTEMGTDLMRSVLTGEHLVRRDLLAELKSWTNGIEHELARPDGRRSVNLDPGMLTAENLVLATTKNRAHRVYLRDGIYAETTLAFVQGRFLAFPWTYPDYRTQRMRGLLESLRAAYLQRLRQGTATITEEVTA